MPTPLGRRTFLGGAAASFVLLGCGGGSEEGAGGATTSTTAGGDDGFPRTVTHGLGTTEIPAKPARIVATADREQLDVLLAMGLRPVQYGFSGDYEVAAPWLDADVVAGLDRADMAEAFVPNLELIASAHPDLIVDAFSDDATHQALSAIAPTIQLKATEADTWDGAQRLAGEATGEEEAAAAAIAETRAVLDEHAEAVADLAGRTVAVAFQQGDQLLVLPGTAIGARVVAELGLDVLGTADGLGTFYSLEQVPDVLGAVDVILSFEQGGPDPLATNPLFTGLPAVQAGGWVALPAAVATAAYQESTLSLRWAAEPVAAAVRTAAEGGGIAV